MKFKRGGPPGPGRPPATVSRRDYLDGVKAAVSREDIRRIADRARRDALAGNGRAREWLTDVLRLSDGVLGEFEDRLAAVERVLAGRPS